MLKIAICDDEKIFLDQIHDMTSQLLTDIAVLHEINCFSSGEELYQILEKDIEFDIAFLDIYMGNMSGIDLGEQIRNHFQNTKTIIIYISSYDNRAKEVFHFNTFRFLSKPIDLSLFKEALLSAYGLWTDSHSKYLIIKDPTIGFLSLKLQNIMYLEVTRSHRIDVVTTKQRFTAYEKLSSFYEQLSSANFLQIHHSCMINSDYIKQMTYEKVTMADGRVLPISGPKRKIIRNQYLILRKKQVMRLWP